MGTRGGPRPGSGRKSAYQELKDARDTESLFFNELNQDELEAKIRTGKFSIRDRYLLTAMEGDTKILESLSKKVLPDKIDIKGQLNISQVLDELDGHEIEGQTLEVKSLIQNQEQEGEAGSVQVEQSAEPLPQQQVVSQPDSES